MTLSSGVATFSGLSYDKAETMNIGFTTNASGVSSATSGNIVVSPAAASQLVINQQPSATATAGQPFATQPVIYEEDQFNNIVTGDNSTVITAMLNSGVGPLQGTTDATVSGGVAQFTNLADNMAETITLKFTSGSLASSPSNPIVVSPGAGRQAGDPDAAVVDRDGRPGVRDPAGDLSRGFERQHRDGRQQHGRDRRRWPAATARSRGRNR